MTILDKFHAITTFLFISFAFLSSANNLFDIEYLPFDNIPKKILNQCKGDIVDTVIWKDKNGIFAFVAFKKKQGKIGETLKSELTVFLFKIFSKDSVQQLWKIYDWANDGLTVIDYRKESRRIIDIDNDGEHESIFIYEKIPDGLEPIEVKLILHHRFQKYAIRGRFPKDEQYLDTYEKNIDYSFRRCDKRIFLFASDYWDKMVREYAKDLLGETLVDSMINIHNDSKKQYIMKPPPKQK